MTELYILRHGIAIQAAPFGGLDDDRPLTREGVAHMRQIARGLRRLDLDLQRIVSSPVKRAWKTAEIVAEVLDLGDRLEPSDALRPNRDAVSIRDWLGTRSEPRLMVVGHNPSLSDLVGLLLTGRPDIMGIELRKGGIAALSSTPTTPMQLQWLSRPRVFRRLLRD